MKLPHLPIAIPLFSGLLLGLSALTAGAAVIDLSKPVSESLTPSGLYWKFDEGAVGQSTPSATDHSGNGYNGTLTPSDTGGLPVRTEGRFGMGVQIDRTSGATPNALDPSVYWGATAAGGNASGLDFAAGGAFTAGLWLKLDAIDTGANQLIYLIERGVFVFRNTTQGATQRNFFSLQMNKWNNDTWTLNLHLGDGINPTVSIGAGKAFSDPSNLDWHHIGFSLETIEGGSRVRFYLDGNLLGEGIVDYTMADLIATNGTERQVRVGERNASSYGSAFNGSVDEVFITSGVHTFMIPEPGSVALLSLAGLGVVVARKALCK